MHLFSHCCRDENRLLHWWNCPSTSLAFLSSTSVRRQNKLTQCHHPKSKPRCSLGKRAFCARHRRFRHDKIPCCKNTHIVSLPSRCNCHYYLGVRNAQTQLAVLSDRDLQIAILIGETDLQLCEAQGGHSRRFTSLSKWNAFSRTQPCFHGQEHLAH